MKSIMQKLHGDHKNFIKLLDFLEQQLDLIEKYERADLELILKAIHYMKEYPDLVHHPLEDVVFNYFLEHHEEVQDELTALLHEHQQMPELTKKLIEMFENVLSDLPQNRKELCDYLRIYIMKQKQHMNHEERVVYPVLNETMTIPEWGSIDSDLKDTKDPLFGRNVEKNYQELLYQVVG